MTRHEIAATVALAMIVAACNASGKPAEWSPPAGTQGTGSADRLVMAGGYGSGSMSYAVVDGGNGRALHRLPAGVPTSDWRVLYATLSAETHTLVRAVDPTSGAVLREMLVLGAWQLPAIGLARVPGGLSADGRALVLQESTAASAVTPTATRFAMVATEGKRAPRVISLPGRFTFDALSPDGTLLYVIEHLTRSDYLVRQVDVASGQLAAGAILDKRNVDERMAGYPATQLLGAEGWVYTIYRGHERDFIHALDTQHGGAVCIDLPGTESADDASAGFWGLALDASGRRLYATNGALGTVSEVSLDGFSIRTRSMSTAMRVTLAKFGGGEGAAGPQVAASPDGSTLYVVGEQGLISIAASDLALTGRLGGDQAYRGLVRSAGGSLYALTASGGIVRIDPASGGVNGALVGGGYSQIVAVLPTTPAR